MTNYMIHGVTKKKKEAKSVAGSCWNCCYVDVFILSILPFLSSISLISQTLDDHCRYIHVVCSVFFSFHQLFSFIMKINLIKKWLDLVFFHIFAALCLDEIINMTLLLAAVVRKKKSKLRVKHRHITRGDRFGPKLY